MGTGLWVLENTLPEKPARKSSFKSVIKIKERKKMQVIIGTKIGMTQIIGEDGMVTPVTILQAGPATVTQIKTVETDGYNAVQDRKSTRLNSSHAR